MWQHIDREISVALGERFTSAERFTLGGGCINTAYSIADGSHRYFVKVNTRERLPMFEAEVEGLRELASSHTVRVPAPLCCGVAEDVSFLVMELLDLTAASDTSAERLGRELAQMHRRTGTQFGWRIDNTIGSTPQINSPSDDWLAFFRRHRLSCQLEKAARNGRRGMREKGQRLAEDLVKLFDGYTPQPSLLHGDLWVGNCAAERGGNPVVFDPAVYYGDREADLAMTELFGGIPSRFYAAYREAWPLDPGYGVRKTLYNLCHILNHFNLFGGGYGAQAEGMIDRLLSELR